MKFTILKNLQLILQQKFKSVCLLLVAVSRDMGLTEKKFL